MPKPIRLIIVGGFLGAGKTTLLWRAAEHLLRKGLRVGLITNDQAPDLVDTKLLEARGVTVGEVAGSCFCCNFPGLLNAAERAQHDAPADVLIAEPVGSCTDLSATILQPLKDRYRDDFALSPLTVLADPQRLREVLSGADDTLHADAAYIFRKQIEEADVLAINKIDLLSDTERTALLELVKQTFPRLEVTTMSAEADEGVARWLEAMLRRGDAGQRIVEVDYDIYAHGEAVLGWLNVAADLDSERPVSWSNYAEGLLGALRAEFAQRGADVGHVKLWIGAGENEVVGNLTRTHGEPVIRAPKSPDTSSAMTRRHAQLVLNARVEMPPDELEQIVRTALNEVQAGTVRASIQEMHCLQPGRPTPTHRYAEVVAAG